jgi:hypothetical protein
MQPHVTKVRRSDHDPSHTGKGHSEYEGIVHHMDLFMCEGAEILSDIRAGSNEYCATASFIGVDKHCHEMPFVYDRGANEFSFPENVGWRVGPGTPYRTVVMAIHYLVPEWWDMETMMVEDQSGFTLSLSTVLRPSNLGSFAFIDEQMTLPVSSTVSCCSISGLAVVLPVVLPVAGFMVPI